VNTGAVHALGATPLAPAGPVDESPIDLALPIPDDLDALWRAVEPATRTRANDVHLPLTVAYAERLCVAHPEANAELVRVTALLHDTGWSRVDEERIFSEGFGVDWKQSRVRFEHEEHGCDIAREVLPGLGYSAEFVDAVVAIIDGHDTRPEAHSLEDALVRDADRLWRFSGVGIAIACSWFSTTPHGYAHLTETKDYPELLTVAGQRLALAELARAKRMFRMDVL
jgi:Predicted HD superfamily hydrolase